MHLPKRQRGFYPRSDAATRSLVWLALAASLLCGPVSGMAGQAGAASIDDDSRSVSEWIRATGDNKALAFAIIDKKTATVHVFDRFGTKLASSPVLLGLAIGDASVPGIGERKMSQIRPEERTTPAGRFITEPGVNLEGKDIVWIDYDAAVSMHRVVTANKAERRLERLATPGVADKRISYGCVNVPAAFYDTYIKPAFGSQPAMVYVLPETSEASAFFHIGDEAPTTLAAGKPLSDVSEASGLPGAAD